MGRLSSDIRSGQRARLFHVCPSTGGLWLARESDGSCEGIFRERREAVKFALAEGQGEAVILFSAEAAAPSWLAVR